MLRFAAALNVTLPDLAAAFRGSNDQEETAHDTPENEPHTSPSSSETFKVEVF
jgi:hypothetical protein